MKHRVLALAKDARTVALSLGLLARSLAATRHAARASAPGLEFASFARSLGLKALRSGDRSGLAMLLTPVSITRYWEFPFVRRHLSRSPGRCLDVSSPRLFSFYVASRMEPGSIRMLNPDRRDAEITQRLAKRLGIPGIVVEAEPASALAGVRDRYDSIWSISVVEHIPETGDVEAMRLMYDALVPGGRLLVTVPVDRHTWTEYRAEDVYALGVPDGPEGTFFQRWYDESTIAERLLAPLGHTDAHLEWFGERIPGRFRDYIADWLRRGRQRTVDDPREIADWYAPFGSWDAMPGQGVCGLAVRKPLNRPAKASPSAHRSCEPKAPQRRIAG